MNFPSLQVIAESLSEEEIAGLKEMFKMMDTDNSGSITFEELKAGLKRVGSELMESEIHELMEAVCVLQLYFALRVVLTPSLQSGRSIAISSLDNYSRSYVSFRFGFAEINGKLLMLPIVADWI